MKRMKLLTQTTYEELISRLELGVPMARCMRDLNLVGIISQPALVATLKRYDAGVLEFGTVDGEEAHD